MSGPSTAPKAPNPMDLYEPLEIIGNGSFGIIRKVRRKSDGEILARKELNFERMSERDRKQIVAEVNILKDLHHENIVRYIDRHVDREAGILYILMEYCDGGDLASTIKQCARVGQPLPEDAVWEYFLQLLLALQQCHCPNSKSGEATETKRQQVLHRDLKPENVFLCRTNGGNILKLGDFGLSKALTQTSFANTYVGTPYYMSPELIQEKSYDTKTDIWSLGCLIYELCALKPPFAEAQTHSELSMLIRNGRIPPLPRGYSSALGQVIKSMLNLNPAMRPSAQQLLQHERIDFARKVADTEKLINSVKMHKANVIAKERELQNLSTALAQREAALSALVEQKDGEILRLTALANQSDERIKRAVAAREEELCVAVMRREEEVRAAMARREEEILEAVRKREEEINTAWQKREEQLRGDLQSAIQWVQARQKELAEEGQKIEAARVKLAQETEEIQQMAKAARRNEKTPLEDVKNLMAPFRHIADEESDDYEATPRRPECSSKHNSDLDTPVASKPSENQQTAAPVPGSAMRGVILTATGEALKTPAPFTQTSSKANAALTNIIKNTPAVGLNFRKIFDFAESDSSDNEDGDGDDTESVAGTMTTTGRSCASATCSLPELNSPTKEVTERRKSRGKEEATATSSSGSTSARAKVTVRRQSSAKIRPSSGLPAPRGSPQKAVTKKVTIAAQPKVRRPSRPSAGRPGLPTSASSPALSSRISHQTTKSAAPTRPAKATRNAQPPPTPYYDPSDEENLPSPFLRRVERERPKMTRVSAVGVRAGAARRKSTQNLLRTRAVVNSAINNAQALSSAATAAAAVGAKGVKAS